MKIQLEKRVEGPEKNASVSPWINNVEDEKRKEKRRGGGLKRGRKTT